MLKYAKIKAMLTNVNIRQITTALSAGGVMLGTTERFRERDFVLFCDKWRLYNLIKIDSHHHHHQQLTTK